MITTAEYQELLGFINCKLIRSRFRGTILAGDIANSIFVAHPRLSLKGLKNLVKSSISGEIKAEQLARLNAAALERKKEAEKEWVENEKATNPEYVIKCQQKNNDWEKEKRKNDVAWKKRRNKKQRNKKRKLKKLKDKLRKKK